MKRNIKKILFTLLICVIFMPKIMAETEVYLTNSFGVEMTEMEYNYLLEYFDESFILTMTQQFF